MNIESVSRVPFIFSFLLCFGREIALKYPFNEITYQDLRYETSDGNETGKWVTCRA